MLLLILLLLVFQYPQVQAKNNFPNKPSSGKTSVEKALDAWFGTKNKMESTNIFNSSTRDSKVLSANPLIERIFVRLIETPTNMRPVKDKEAPATAT